MIDNISKRLLCTQSAAEARLPQRVYITVLPAAARYLFDGRDVKKCFFMPKVKKKNGVIAQLPHP